MTAAAEEVADGCPALETVLAAELVVPLMTLLTAGAVPWAALDAVEPTPATVPATVLATPVTVDPTVWPAFETVDPTV